MSVWSREQVNAVRGIYARMQVDDLVRDRQGLREAAHSKAHRTIKAMAQTWAVEPDPRDIRIVREEPDPITPVRTIWTWAWMPDVRTVRLLGGPQDGEMVEVRDVGQVLEVAILRDQPFDLDPNQRQATDPVGLDKVVLGLAGWNEDDRVWIHAEV